MLYLPPCYLLRNIKLCFFGAAITFTLVISAKFRYIYPSCNIFQGVCAFKYGTNISTVTSINILIMFYPADDIDEIMPDAIVPSIEKKISSNHKNRIGYFTRRQKTLKELVAMKKQAKKLEIKPIDHLSEGTKGVVPIDMLIHATVLYSYKHGNIALNGLDNSTNKNVTKQA